MVGVPVLTGLALGAFSYRTHKDPLLFLHRDALHRGAVHDDAVRQGYLDNITVLFLLCFLLAFFAPARTSWGARTAVFLIGMGGRVHAPDDLRDLRRVADGRVRSALRHEPVLARVGAEDRRACLLSAGFGMIFGLATWLIGPWGVNGSLADAALPPPYTQEVFTARLVDWVKSMQPVITVPLILLAIGCAIWTARTAARARRHVRRAAGDVADPAAGRARVPRRRRLPLLPLLQRHRRAVRAAGLRRVGGRALVPAARGRPEDRRRDRRARRSSRRSASCSTAAARPRSGPTPRNQWIDQPTRTVAGGGRAVVETEPGPPDRVRHELRRPYASYGWAKTYTNVSRTGLPGDAVKRDFSYFGDVGRFTELAAAGFPGYGEGPLLLTDPTYNKMTLGLLRRDPGRCTDVRPAADRVPRPSVQRHTPNETALDRRRREPRVALRRRRGRDGPGAHDALGRGRRRRAHGRGRDRRAVLRSPRSARQPAAQPARDPRPRDPARRAGRDRRPLVRARGSLDADRAGARPLDRADDPGRVHRRRRCGAAPFSHRARLGLDRPRHGRGRRAARSAARAAARAGRASPASSTRCSRSSRSATTRC